MARNTIPVNGGAMPKIDRSAYAARLGQAERQETF